MTHLFSYLHTVHLVAMTLLWLEIKGLGPFTATCHEINGRKYVLCYSSICTSVCSMRLFPLSFPLWPRVLSRTCLHWANLTLDVMWIHTARLVMRSGLHWKETFGSYPSSSFLKCLVTGSKIKQIRSFSHFSFSPPTWSELIRMEICLAAWLSG